jgi:hypothetical protein
MMTRKERQNILLAPLEITGAVAFVERAGASAIDGSHVAANMLSRFIVFLPKKNLRLISSVLSLEF